MKLIIKAMISEYGSNWDKMSDKDQLGAIAAFLNNYILITNEFILI